MEMVAEHWPNRASSRFNPSSSEVASRWGKAEQTRGGALMMGSATGCVGRPWPVGPPWRQEYFSPALPHSSAAPRGCCSQLIFTVPKLQIRDKAADRPSWLPGGAASLSQKDIDWSVTLASRHLQASVFST